MLIVLDLYVMYSSAFLNFIHRFCPGLEFEKKKAKKMVGVFIEAWKFFDSSAPRVCQDIGVTFAPI